MNNRRILFLGSGVSINSGLPSVNDISKELYFGKHNYIEKNNFIHCLNNYIEDNEMKRIRRLLKFIDDINSTLLADSAPYLRKGKVHYSGALFSGETNYEDLYFMISEIHRTSQGLSKQSTTNALIHYIESNSGVVLQGSEKGKRILDLNKLCARAKHYFDWLIPQLLIHEKVKGLDLVLELAKDKNPLSIITLNHDLTIEDLLQSNEIEYDDGFNGKNISTEFKSFTGFKDSSKIKLIKPHGSINWMFHEYKICRLNTLEVLEQSEYKLMKILTGTNKILSYNMGVFSDMFYQMHSSLNSSMNMIMSGYGWGDEGINMRLNNWLDQKESKLTLLHARPEELKEGSYSLKGIMDNFIKKGKIVVLEKWLSDTKINEL